MAHPRYRYDSHLSVGTDRRRGHSSASTFVRRRLLPKRRLSAQFLEPLDRRHDRRQHQRDDGSDDEGDWDDVEYSRRRTFPYPTMAMVCLPPFGCYHDEREESDYEFCGWDRMTHSRFQPSHRHHHKNQHQSRHRSNNSRSSPSDEYGFNYPNDGIRSQRVHSLQAMARVQRNAACVIQREFRFYRNRSRNRRRQLDQLLAQAKEVLDRFLCDEMLQSVVSDSLLEVLREDIAKRSFNRLSSDTALLSCTECIYHDLLSGVVSDVFQVVLDAMVRDYMVARLDLSRASQPSVHTVAQDILSEWIRELVAEILPEALSELALSYINVRRQDECLQSLLCDELHDVAIEASVEMTLSAMLDSLSQC